MRINSAASGELTSLASFSNVNGRFAPQAGLMPIQRAICTEPRGTVVQTTMAPSFDRGRDID
jgi:hypothetical protein